MKKLILLVFTVFLNNLFAQTAIPNFSFEDWTNNNPDSWHTSNIPGLPPVVTATTNAYSGTYAARGQSYLYNNNVLPVSMHCPPTGSMTIGPQPAFLTFYYIFNQVNFDRINIVANITTQSGGSVGTFYTNITTPASNYTFVSIPISYSIYGLTFMVGQIHFGLADQTGGFNVDTNSFFIVDDFVWSGIAGVDDFTVSAKGLSVFPQPASTSVSVIFNKPLTANMEFSIYDINCKKVATYKYQAGDISQVIDVSNFKNGIYSLRSDDGKFSAMVFAAH